MHERGGRRQSGPPPALPSAARSDRMSALVSTDVVAQRLRDLESLTDAALAHMPLEQLLDELLVRVRDILMVDTAAILLLDRDVGELVARAAKGIEEEVERGVRIPVGAGFAGRIAASRASVRIRDIDKADIYNPLLRERGIKSLLGVPLLVEGDVLGVMHVGSLVQRDFTDSDAELLQRAADRAALAIQGRLTERERGLAEALQRSLLPRLPQVPGIELDGRYVPAASTQLGGDWYDAFLLPGGALGVAIGDVVGRGFHAAAVMGQLRSSLRAYALDRRSPGEVLQLLGQLLRQIEPGGSATVLYLVLEPDEERITYASAGHPPPLIVTPDGDSRIPEVKPAVPLGAVRHHAYEEGTAELPAGDKLVLFTDGLVEQPGEPLDTGLARMRAIARRHGDDARVLATELIHTLMPPSANDDVAVLVVALTPVGDELDLQLEADADLIPVMRRLLARWLRRVRATDAEIGEIALACSEASANAIEHAYSPLASSFRVMGRLSGDTVRITVSDAGGWRDPRGVNRGRGMLLMEGLMDDVEVDSGEAGTAVTLVRRLRREAA
jgi:serine phosphatase RsbU (regulator of sigma subunit)/anti-sigma regulatory factor (Ser/Thr protein kinase)